MERIAKLLDMFRVVPRAILVFYGYLIYYVVSWFMGLPDPTTQQAALVTTVTAIAAPIIGLYTSTGFKWDKKE